MQPHTITITQRCKIDYKGVFGTNLSEPIKLRPSDYFTELKNGWWRLTQVNKPAWKESESFEVEFSYSEINEFCGLNLNHFKEEKGSSELEF